MTAGIRLGSFALERPFARGGMAEVWRGVHVGEQMPVAVKVLTGPRARDEAFVRALKNEIHAVARLDHPGIILLYDRGEVSAEAAAQSNGRLLPGSPWFAMEMCSHGALSPRRFPLPWPTTRLLLLSLLDALAHAHARGVVHRDLKPGNILLCAPDDPRPGLKLSDFGIAKALELDQSTVAGDAHSGTPRYMAPEQFTGRAREIGPWTDLYALGCIAFQLASGSAPFGGDALRLAVAHCHDPVPPLRAAGDSFPPGFEAWVLRLLEKDPRDRFRIAADAAWALLQLTPDDDVTQSHSGSWADALRSLRPRPLYPDEEPSLALGSDEDDDTAARTMGAAQDESLSGSGSAGLAGARSGHAARAADVRPDGIERPGGDGDITGPQLSPIAHPDDVRAAGSDVEVTTAPGRRGRASSMALASLDGPSRSAPAGPPGQTPDRPPTGAGPPLPDEGAVAVVEDDDPFARMLAGAAGDDDEDDEDDEDEDDGNKEHGEKHDDEDDDDERPPTRPLTFGPQDPWVELAALQEQRARRDVDPWPTIGSPLERTQSRRIPVDVAAPLRKVRAPVEPPPLPPSWRRPDEHTTLPGAARTRRLLGAGLGLFGLRQPLFVNRSVERSRLWAQLRRGHGAPGDAGRAHDAVVVVRGPAGIGRTRLCTWFAERAAEVGAAHALLAHHVVDDGPFAGLAMALRRHARVVGLRDQALRAALAQAWPDFDGEDVVALGRFLDDPACVPRAEAHALLRRALLAVAVDRPAIVVLEDAHVAPDVVDFAAAFAAAATPHGGRQRGVLLLVDIGDEALAEDPARAAALARLTARGEEFVPPGDDDADDIDTVVAGAAPVSVQALRPLSTRDHRLLVEGLLGLEPGLVDLVARKSAGNPRFAVEIVGDLVGRDVIEPAPAGFALRKGATVEIPDDVHVAWSARLQRLLSTLPLDARVCLELGALLGRDGDEREWHDVCVAAGLADARATIAAVADAGERARFLVVDEGRLRFASAALRESAARLAAEAGRADAHHRVIAHVLRRDGRPTVADRERRARHLLLAGEPAEALPLLLTATSSTLTSQGSGPALALVDEVFSALDRHGFAADEPLRATAMALRARTLIEAGRYGEGTMWARLVRDDAAPLARLWAARALARAALLQGDLAAAVERYTALLALAGRRADELAALSPPPLASPHSPHSPPSPALAWPDEPALVDEIVDDALLGLADGHAYRGDLVEAGATLARALDRAQARDDDGAVALCLWGMAFVARWRGDEVASRELLLRQQKLARRAGSKVLVALGRNALGDLERLAGRTDDARAHYEEAERQLLQCGSGKARLAALNRALCDVERDLDAAVLRVEHLLPDVERAGERGLLAACHGVLALGALVAGDGSAADAHCAALLQPLQAGVRDGELALVAEQIAATAARLGDSWRAGLAASWAREVWRALGRTDRAP
jgi:serine/threonine protein kinase